MRAFTLVSQDLIFKGELEITTGFVIKLKNLDIQNFSFAEATNSVVGNINLTILNGLLWLGSGLFLNAIRAIFLFGFPLGSILKFLNADVIDLDKISLTPHAEYFSILLTPKFNFDKMKSIIIQWILRWLNLLNEVDPVRTVQVLSSMG